VAVDGTAVFTGVIKATVPFPVEIHLTNWQWAA
jgi:hypothetical protein